MSRSSNSIRPTNIFTEFSKQEIEQSIAKRFEKQVKKYPQNLAVITENYQWTYSQLNQEANRIARMLLLQKKINEETRIALLFDHDAPMIAAILAVLKVGQAYVPLDPKYPAKRVFYILEDSLATVILTNQNNLAQAQELAGGSLLIINIDANTANNNNYFEDIDQEISADTLAYLLYTSGSTGQPKGVMQNHRNVLHFIRNYTNNLHISSNDRLTLLSSYSFDAAVMGIFGALLNGATLCLFDIGKAGFSNLSRWLNEQEITIYHSTPTVFRYFVGYLTETNEFKTIRLVVLGGEEVVKRDVELYQKTFSEQCLLINGLGPTESTVTLQYFINKRTEISNTRVPVGYPVEDTEIFLLDESGNITNIDGEIAISSPYIALGYWRKPELTQAVFLENLVHNNRRVYRTGDWGCWRDDGSLEFLGRKDNQVKIRGFRIELAEIEAALSNHKEVKETVVIATKDPANDQRLIAYIVRKNLLLPTVPKEREKMKELRFFLQDKLPDYMIPSAFIFLEALPLTPNGKIDRLSLPIPSPSRSQTGDSFVPPRNSSEETLAQIWAKVLRLEWVSRDDNFFELGGHSLLATQVILRIREVFALEIPLGLLFDYPILGEFTEKISQIQPIEPSLLLPPLQPRLRPENLPLSFAQERLWFLNQLQGNGATYNITTALSLQGKLNLSALEQALATIRERHEILRTNFISENGSPFQVIREPLPVNLPLINLQHLDSGEQNRQIEQLIRENAHYSFNLATEPLLRICLLHLGELSYFLLLTIHHLIADNWSMGIFVQEISTLYQAYSQGKIPLLEPLPIQYADFALWQKQEFSPTILTPQLNYWQQQLAALPPLLALPTDKPRPALQSFSGNSRFFQLPAELSQQLRKFSQQSGVTLYMTLLAVFSVLLLRYSCQTDIPIGTVIANRNRKEIEALIGFFANTLVLRLDLRENPRFIDFLPQVRQIALAAYSHQDLPFEKLVEELQPERSLSYHPLFQVLFAWQNTPEQQWELPGLTIREQPLDTGSAKFDLTLLMEEKGEIIQGQWEYSTDLFEAATIEGMLSHFQTLLEAVIANPEVRVEALPLLTESERHQLLVEWNQTQSDYPQDKCIHQLFEEQVARTPNAVAVVSEGENLTYQELNQKANQLAHYLQQLGVKPDTLVGICLERSLEMIIGLLGILKAGGAYLPLDVNYPTERLAFIVEDTQISILLTQQSLREKLPQHQASVVCLDTDWTAIATESWQNPPSQVQSHHLVYVIYTSGSTGQPKGVLIPHSALVNLVFWHQNAFKITINDRATQLAGNAFDASVWELWPYLTAGVPIHLVPPTIVISPLALRDWLISQKITVTFLPTPLADILLTMTWDKSTQLRLMLTGGDELHHYPSPSLPFLVVNNYGPTENTVVTTSGLVVCQEGTLKEPSIGRPIANTQVYVLDSNLEPVPIGVPGELHIGGVGLGRGYLNRPELTAEKFIPNPFDKAKFKTCTEGSRSIQNSKLYKTGDLVRYLPDGNIEYLGRIDNQVKIRGFRIELGEIEAVLSQHSQVQESVVIIREDLATVGSNQLSQSSLIENRDKCLVAYIVLASSQNSPALNPLNQEAKIESPPPPLEKGDNLKAKIQNQLRSFLKEKLPDYMIPTAFVFLEALPLTANGKIDRRALPKPEDIPQEEAENLVAPRNELESQLTQIWQEVLGRKPLSIQDNFFDMGGHSLLAVRLFSQIQKQLKQDLPLATLYQAPTIAEFAQILTQKGWKPTWSSLVPVQPKGNKRPFFFHGGTADALTWANFARLLGDDQPFYALQRPDLAGQSISTMTVEELATLCLQEIRSVQPQGPYLIGGHCFGGTIAFEMAQQLQSQGEETDFLVLIDAYAPITPMQEKTPFVQLQASWSNLDFWLSKNYYYHADNLRQRGWLGKLSYIWEKLRSKSLAKAKLKQAASQKSLSPKVSPENPSTVESLPYEVRYHLAGQANQEARKEYIPSPYGGQIILFRASKQELEWKYGHFLGWETLTTEVEIYQIPGFFGNLFNRYSLPLLVEKVKFCLDKYSEDNQTNGNNF